MDSIRSGEYLLIVGIFVGAGVTVCLYLLWSWYRGLGGAQARDAVRRWWRSGIATAPQTIRIRRRDGSSEDMRPVRASGLHLVVAPLQSGQRTWETVSAGDAVDREQYWRIWRFYGGQASGWIDDDGDEFVPS